MRGGTAIKTQGIIIFIIVFVRVFTPTPIVIPIVGLLRVPRIPWLPVTSGIAFALAAFCHLNKAQKQTKPNTRKLRESEIELTTMESASARSGLLKSNSRRCRRLEA